MVTTALIINSLNKRSLENHHDNSDAKWISVSLERKWNYYVNLGTAKEKFPLVLLETVAITFSVWDASFDQGVPPRKARRKSTHKVD